MARPTWNQTGSFPCLTMGFCFVLFPLCSEQTVGSRFIPFLLPMVSPCYRLPASRHPLPEVSRSPTDTVLERLLFVRSESTKSRPISWFARLPSSVLSVRLLKTSSLIFVSSLRLSWHCKRLPKPTLLVSLKTPTCALSMPSVSQSCPRISSWLVASVGNVPKAAGVHRWRSIVSNTIPSMGSTVSFWRLVTTEKENAETTYLYYYYPAPLLLLWRNHYLCAKLLLENIAVRSEKHM